MKKIFKRKKKSNDLMIQGKNIFVCIEYALVDREIHASERIEKFFLTNNNLQKSQRDYFHASLSFL